MTKFAVIKTGGKQYKIQEGETFLVDKLDDPKKTVEFSEVLLISDEKETKIGTPFIANAKVSAEVLVADMKGEKITTVKYKPKKRYKRKVGFRPEYTKVKITKIS